MKKKYPPNADLKNELARMRVAARIHQGATIIYDWLPTLTDQSLKTEVLNILTVLRNSEERLDNLKVV